MPDKTKDELTQRAQLVRVFEAAAGIDYPTDDDLVLRSQLNQAIRQTFALPTVQPPRRAPEHRR